MTSLNAEIAALPKMPEWKGGTIKWTYPDYMAEDLPEFYLASVVGAYQARLALLRRVLQEMVDCCMACGGDGHTEGFYLVDEKRPCRHCADARKVLEVTKP